MNNWIKENKISIIVSIIIFLILIFCIFFSIFSKQSLNKENYNQFLINSKINEQIKTIQDFFNYANSFAGNDKTEYYKILYGNLWSLQYSWDFITYLGITFSSGGILVLLCYYLFSWMGNRN